MSDLTSELCSSNWMIKFWREYIISLANFVEFCTRSMTGGQGTVQDSTEIVKKIYSLEIWSSSYSSKF